MAKPPLNGVAETEYTKSQQGGLTPSSFRTTGGVHELVARVMRGKYVRQMAKRKSAVSRSPQSHLYHASEHITRESRADSCTHCLHARIYRWELTDSRSERGRRRRDRVFEFGCRHCGVRALTGWRACFLFCLSAILEARFAVVAETGHPIFGAGAESLYSGGINIPPHTAQNAQKTAFAPHCFR